MNDQKAIAFLRTGKDGPALDILYKGFPAVRRMILSKGGGPGDAEDIFQEALIILIRKVKREDFILTAQLSSYLFSVCRLLWKEEQKKRKLPLADAPGAEVIAHNEWEETMEREARARLAEAALGRLKDRCRELLILFYEGGRRLKEMAYKMGYSSEGTAKNQKYKCLESARVILKELQQATTTF